MDLDHLERTNLQHRIIGDFTSAYEELQAALTEVSLRGTLRDKLRVKTLLALTYYKDGPRQIHRALAICDEVLPQMGTWADEASKALINGLTMAMFAGDIGRTRNWSLRLRALHITKGAAITRWLGRSLLVLARAALAQGERERALAFAAEAVEFHKVHGGPFTEHDRLCYLALSYADMCEIVVESDPQQARTLLDQAHRLMPSEARGEILHYLEALVAHVSGQPEAVSPWLDMAFEGAARNRDHWLKFKVAELGARHAMVVQRADVRHILDAVIREAAEGRMITVLDRLQRLRATVA